MGWKVNLAELRALERQQREALQETNKLIDDITNIPAGWELQDEHIIRSGTTAMRGSVTDYSPDGDAREYAVQIAVDDHDSVCFRWNEDGYNEETMPCWVPFQAILAAVEAHRILLGIKKAEQDKAREARIKARST